MIRRTPKPGKVAIVLFLTVLIWVWADLALDETPPARRARITVVEPSEELWVSFSQAPHVDAEVTLSGPHSAFNELGRILKQQPVSNRLDFAFDASTEQMDQPGGHKLQLLDFLQKNEQLRRLGLKVKDCDPNVVDVNVVELVQKPLPIECVDEEGSSITPESIDPSTVRMYVPESCRKATVQLSRREIKDAKSKQIDKRPYVLLTPDQRRPAPNTVKIKLAEDESPLSEGTIQIAKLAIAMSPEMIGKYRIEFENLPNMIGPIKIRATAAAKERYQNMPHHVRLELDEDDAGPQPDPKALVYNFPEEYLRSNEIELAQPIGEAKFKLIKITPENL